MELNRCLILVSYSSGQPYDDVKRLIVEYNLPAPNVIAAKDVIAVGNIENDPYVDFSRRARLDEYEATYLVGRVARVFNVLHDGEKVVFREPEGEAAMKVRHGRDCYELDKRIEYFKATQHLDKRTARRVHQGRLRPPIMSF